MEKDCEDTPGNIQTQSNHGLDVLGGTSDADFGYQGGNDDDDDANDDEIMDGKNEVGLVVGSKPSNTTDKTSHQKSARSTSTVAKNQAENRNRNTSATIASNSNQNTLETTESVTSPAHTTKKLPFDSSASSTQDLMVSETGARTSDGPVVRLSYANDSQLAASTSTKTAASLLPTALLAKTNASSNQTERDAKQQDVESNVQVAADNHGGDQHKDSTSVSNVIKQASRANDNRNSDGGEPSRKKLESNVVAACKYFIKKRFLLNFKHITRDNIQNPDDDYTRLALAIGDFARARDRPQNHDDYSIICDQLRHLRVTDIRGIIAKVFDVMKHTLYIDTPLKKRYKQITIISKHDGTWRTSEIVYVSNQFKASKTENWDFDCGDTVFINGGKKFIVTYLLLQNKNGKFLEITKTKDMDYRYYQVNGGKSCTVKQLQCRYKTYGIVLIHYDSGNEFTKDLADDCGGCKEILATTRAADKHDTVADTRRFDTEFTQNLADNYEGNNEVPVTTEVADHDNRGCFPAALTLLLNRFGFQYNSPAVTLYCQHVGIDWKDGDSIPFALLEDALQKRTDLESPGENMHFEKINHFLRKNAMIFVGEADPLGEEDRLKRQILKGEDVNKYKLKPRYKHYITHGNNIWEKEDGIFFVLVKYRDENEDESTTPAENRHVLLFDAKNRFVGDKDDNFELTVEEGEDDDQVQQKLKDLWKEQYLTFTVANVWEFKKKQNQKQS